MSFYNRYKAILFLGLLLFSQMFMFAQDNEDKIQQNILAGDKYLNDGNKAEAARLYNQTAYLYRTSGNIDEAIKYYQKVLQLNTESGNKVGQMLTHSNLSMLYIESKKYNEALKHLNAELEFREKNKKMQEIIPVIISIAGVYNEMNQYEDALENANKAAELSLELNNLILLKRSYGMVYDIYSNWGKTEQAQTYFGKYSAVDKKIKEVKMAAVESEAKQKISVAYSEKAKTEQELQETTQHLEETERIAQQQKLELDLQQALINEQDALLRVEKLKKTYFLWGFIISLIFVFILGFLVFRIINANKKINSQRFRLEKQNREIHASIRYAKTIQKAMLPDLSAIKNFANHFVIFRPKDIVSGDFYWSSVLSDTRMFFAVVDCTGHGVPGAFMSMIGIRMLDEIVNDRKIESPATILENLNQILRNALRQEQTDNNDGMDLVICRFDKRPDGKVDVVFSGAKRPLYIGRNSGPELEKLSPDRKSIGGYQPAKREIDFTDQKVTLQKGDNVYLFTDGIVDQNDPLRKKFGRARLENLIKTVQNDDSDRQKQVIEKELNDFVKDQLQRDDITFAGLKIN